MNIAIVGLGLIGGSIAKAIKYNKQQAKEYTAVNAFSFLNIWIHKLSPRLSEKTC